MEPTPLPGPEPPPPSQLSPFRRALLRGLGIITPPLLTIVVLVLVWNTIISYVLAPIEAVVRVNLVWYLKEEFERPPANATHQVYGIVDGHQVVTSFQYEGRDFVRIPDGMYVPREVYQRVKQDPGKQIAATSEAIYHRYVEIVYLKRQYVAPAFLLLFLVTLYFLGRFFAAGIGRIVWNTFEKQLLNRLPIIRQIYSAAKQVSDFIFSEHNIQFTRVVAVEWPRRGIWSIGFATGESMLDIGAAANEPVVSVLIPNSPMPATGFTITVRKSEVVDLDISIDQAIQFVVSCGVVVPLQQQYRLVGNELVARHLGSAIDKRTRQNTGNGQPRQITPAQSETSAKTKEDGKPLRKTE